MTAGGGGAGAWRPTWAEIDLEAIRHNVRLLVARAAPAAVCAVVKADAYGHGAVAAARAAVEGGATWLAVALVEEGEELRRAGIDTPILVLAEPPPPAMGALVAAGLTPTVYTRAGVAAVVAAAAGRPPGSVGVHLKVDTGMHRVGADPAEAVALARAVVAGGLRLGGTWTHLAVADEPAQAAYTSVQLRRLEAARDALVAEGIPPGLVHAANSAATLAGSGARYDLVRCGIAVYGYSPLAPGGPPLGLRPALALKSRVSLARTIPAGERLSYGLRYRLGEASTVATVPVGYADGVPRRLSAVGGAVLVGGRRRPIAGTVTMDQLLVDCGPAAVAAGDEVVLIGSQGGETVGADEWAGLLDTIPYEILCGISRRVPRVLREQA